MRVLLIDEMHKTILKSGFALKNLSQGLREKCGFHTMNIMTLTFRVR